MEHVSRTQHYLKVKKPMLERQRRARINKCLDSMKHIIAELQNDKAILRMDKAEMLEATIAHLRQMKSKDNQKEQAHSFQNGYLNAANEVSRVLASTRGMRSELGKAIMTHLGCQFNRVASNMKPMTVSIPTAPVSPASSGYHSDMESPASSPSTNDEVCEKLWRPW